MDLNGNLPRCECHACVQARYAMSVSGSTMSLEVPTATPAFCNGSWADFTNGLSGGGWSDFTSGLITKS
jgi:hypothetical protein